MAMRGYLIKHSEEKGQIPKVYFFELEEGVISFFDEMDGQLMGTFPLTGCKIVVRAQKRNDEIPNSFYVEKREVFVNGKAYTLGPKKYLELSCLTPQDRQEWGNTIFSWQRHYFPELKAGDLDDHRLDREALHAVVDKFFPTPKLSESITLAVNAHLYTIEPKTSNVILAPLHSKLSTPTFSTQNTKASVQVVIPAVKTQEASTTDIFPVPKHLQPLLASIAV